MKYIAPLNESENAPFVDGDAGKGTVGSRVPAAALEHPQREIMAVIEEADITPDAQNLTQLYHAIRKLCAPAGQTMAWSGSLDNVPDGFLVCAGQAISRTIYADLYASLGTIHGTGDGATTFNLPDLQDRFVIGRSGSKEVADTGGDFSKNISGNVSGNTNNHALTIAQMPSHDHRLRSVDGWAYNTSGLGHSNNNDVNQASLIGGLARNLGTIGWYLHNNKGDRLIEKTGGTSGHSHGVNINFNINNTDVTNPYYALIYMIRT